MKAAGEEALSKTGFGKKLTERGFDKGKVGGHRGWYGISIGGTDA